MEEQEKKKLRRRAVRKVRNARVDASELTHEDSLKLVQELRVHQVELETQNEELHAAQQDLIRARDRYRDLYDYAPVGYLTLNKHNFIGEANITACRMLGTKKADLLGRRLTKFIAPESQDEFYRHRREIMLTGNRQTCELFIRRFDGGSFWSAVDCTWDFDGMKVTITDITELKKAEAELKIKDYAVASATSGIAIMGLDGTIGYVNRALLEMGEYREKDILGKSAYLFFEDKKGAAEAFKTLKKDGFWQGDLTVRKKNGVSFKVQAIANRVGDDKGKPVCLMAFVVDITERIRMEELLARHASVLSAIMANTDTQLVYFDRDFNFILANKAYIDSCGHTWDELKGKNHFSIFPNAKNEAIFRRVRDTGEPLSFSDMPFRYADQPWRGITYWDWMLVPVKDGSGGTTGLVLSLIETTKRKQAEQLKDDFIGMVSHELRTPLTVFLGAVKVAMSAEVTSEEVRELLKHAASSAESMSHLIENLLELSRCQASRLVLEPRPLDVGEVIREMVVGLAREKTGRPFIMDISEDIPPVEADRLRLEQVLRNLLDNAVKYSPDGAEIRVTAAKDRHDLKIGVHDRGRGIGPEDRKRLFRSFERLEETSNQPGLGIGLLLCKRLVESHGGQIWVESEPDKGSSFWFTLPLERRPD
jgi:PAS domain S-box-containing protein